MTKFTASYSSGKDCTFAVYKAIQSGMEPLGLIMTFNADRAQRWFHTFPKASLARLSDCLGIRIDLLETNDKNYEKDFENKLREFKALGAEACVFGDVDVEIHFTWQDERCRNTGLTPYIPLRHANRRKTVKEFLDCGFVTYITTVDTQRLDKKFLGKKLTYELMDELEAAGVDVCGENGEYHSLVTDGPLFKKPFDFAFGDEVFDGRYAKLPLL